MKRKWKLGCGASLEVLQTPDEQQGAFTVRIEGRRSDGWFAQLNDPLSRLPLAQGSDVKLVILRKAIPKFIKILQYLEKSVDKS